jgi:hypothetical protein
MAQHQSHSGMINDDPPPAQPPDGTKIQVTLLTLALFVMVAFQTVQLIRERGNLGNVWASQEPTIQEGIKLRKQLDTLANETARLAAAGDAGASAIIEELRRQGITVKPPGDGH